MTSPPSLLCLILVGHLISWSCNAEYVQIKPVVEDETVLWSQEEDAGYQIPLIGLTTQGALIAFNQEGQGITILERRLSFDIGKEWTVETRVMVNNRFFEGGKLVGLATDNEANMMFLVYSQCPDALSQCSESMTYVMKSDNDGQTWSNRMNLTDKVGGLTFVAGPGQGIQKKHPPHMGRILFCGHSYNDTSDTLESLICVCSDDHGGTWKGCAKLPSIPYKSLKMDGDFVPGVNQVVELRNGTLLFTISNKNKYHAPARIFAQSYDGGDTISPQHVYIEERLPDPGGIAGMIYLENYNLLLHSNAFNGSRSVNLTLSWSYDSGATWNTTDMLQVWPGPSSYSCLTAIPDRPGYVGLLYEKVENGTIFITYALINLQHV